MASVTWTPEARADLDHIEAYIAERSPEYAPVFVEKLIQATLRLLDFPRSGRRVPEFDVEELRDLDFLDYRIVYELLGDDVVIDGVFHGSMDLKRQAEERGWSV